MVFYFQDQVQSTTVTTSFQLKTFLLKQSQKKSFYKNVFQKLRQFQYHVTTDHSIDFSCFEVIVQGTVRQVASF